METTNSDRLIDASDDVLCREIKELVQAWEAHNNDSENDVKALALARAVYRLQGNLSIHGLQRSEIIVGVCKEDNPADVDETYGAGTYARLFPSDDERCPDCGAAG